MCGIFCCFCEKSVCHPNNLLNVFEVFEANLKKRGPDSFGLKTQQCGDQFLVFAASVLWLQGRETISQPLESEKSVFVYNGDIFGGTVIEQKTIESDGDTACLWRSLELVGNIIEFLAKLEGPYSFIFLNKDEKQLYFARDPYGRRSLLLGNDDSGIITLCSVAKRTKDFKFIEVPTIGVFCYDLTKQNLKLLPWPEKNKNFNIKLEELEKFVHLKIEVLSTSHEGYCEKFHSPTSLQIKQLDLAETNIFEKLLADSNWLKNVTHLKDLLETAIEKRIATQPQFCSACLLKQTVCNHALTGVLFSGGLDCAILSLLADKYTKKHRPIDLLNVAFNKANDYKTPDRQTGLQTLEELKKLRPERAWNFVEINVTQEELNKERTQRIADLIYPLNSVLDDSLGCALWFASRGLKANYKSPCRVLLVGMGADELFGGYTKHRNAFKRNGWQGLRDILEEDWQNLPHRNLARDDRVVSDHGRQLRTPYLDENVVKFVKELDVWEKTRPTTNLPQGIGEKLLLRSLAYYLGLKEAAVLKKRALQFGSRIANSKENANDISDRLL